MSRLISILTLIVLSPFALLAGAFLVANAGNMEQVGLEVGEFARRLGQLLLLALVLAIASGAALVVLAIWQRWSERDRERDGSYRIREYKVRDPATGEMARIIVDPNLMLTPALAVGASGVRELGSLPHEVYAANAQQRAATVSSWQARMPGDAAIVTANGSMYRTGPAGRQLTERPYPRAAITGPVAEEAQAPVTVELPDAMRQAAPDTFPLGYGGDGRLALFNPRQHGSAAIVGSTGTGKTTSVGFLLAAHALRAGWHVVILDADNGVAWSPFARQAEHLETDEAMIGDQLAALGWEFERRLAILRSAGAQDVDGVSGVRRILIVVEEYGGLINTLRIRSRSAAEAVDNQLDTLLRRGRKAGMHFALIDQYPESWSNQLVAGTKGRYVFQLGPNQGAKLQEYKANELPDRGAFLHQGRQFTAWHAAPKLQRLLCDVPALDVRARVVDVAANERPERPEWANGPTNGSERLPPDVASGNERANGERGSGQNPTPHPPFDVRSSPKRDVVFWWRDQHPAGSQAEFRTWLADHGSSMARGYISDTFALWEEGSNT